MEQRRDLKRERRRPHTTSPAVFPCLLERLSRARRFPRFGLSRSNYYINTIILAMCGKWGRGSVLFLHQQEIVALCAY